MTTKEVWQNPEHRRELIAEREEARSSLTVNLRMDTIGIQCGRQDLQYVKEADTAEAQVLKMWFQPMSLVRGDGNSKG